MSRTIFAESDGQRSGHDGREQHPNILADIPPITNVPVLVAALGVGAERFKGYYDNADFGKKLKALMEGKKHE